MRMHRLLFPCLAMLLLLAGGACVIAAAAAAPETSTVVMAKDFMFAPTSMTVEPHTVVSAEGLFRSAALDTEESFSFRFDKPGTYRYTCSIHPRMVGTIVVR